MVIVDIFALRKKKEQFVILIRRRCYKAVSMKLEKDIMLVFQNLVCNEHDMFMTVMTVLEYSIFLGDGKMALLFFLRGADPIHNKFNGEIFTVESERTRGAAPDVMPHFTRGETIPGFRGLRALLQPNRGNRWVAEQYLWLMERCGPGPGTLREQLAGVPAAFRRIGAASHWRRELADVLHG